MTNGRTDGPTKQGVESRSTRLKTVDFILALELKMLLGISIDVERPEGLSNLQLFCCLSFYRKGLIAFFTNSEKANKRQ